MTDAQDSTGRTGTGGRGALDPNQVTPLTPELYDYVLANNPPLDTVQRELVTTTRELLPERAQMQVSEDQGPLLAFLVKLTGAGLVVEVGTFTGLSALCMAQALPPDGRLITCDVSEEWTAHGRTAWQKAGVADRVDLRVAPALDTLRALPAEPEIDLVFIDADKESQIAYWDELVPRVRPGGLIVVDNVFFHGEVTGPEARTASGRATRAFNEHVRDDARVESVMLTIADGLTLARKI
ncbi:O-methyltransferase [Streptomyces lycii]|uniref:O-methyltransferase n=1 Tax=Streptomyces lycii TaxID=2654337 RepID=A0ABQ7F986_9ACTN|nr:O-methyltransferase [Streptomyces lycii]